METIDVMKEFYNAIEENRIKAYYQPIFYVDESSLYSAEALCRIQLRDGRILTPDKFIPILERTGEICILDWIMIDKACEMACDIIEATVSDVRISVNFSRWHVNEWDAVEHLCSIVDSYYLSRDKIQIEITESYKADDYLLNNLMLKLRSAGFPVAIDDFGEGYTSLQFIKDNTFDILKIDRSLVKNADQDNSAAIIRGITEMAKSLGIKVVAEGVENLNQAIEVVLNGCNFVQGNYLEAPMPEEEFVSYVLKEEGKTLESKLENNTKATVPA